MAGQRPPFVQKVKQQHPGQRVEVWLQDEMRFGHAVVVLLTLIVVSTACAPAAAPCALKCLTPQAGSTERLRLMKRTALLINTSRGPLIVDQDLADALNSGVIAGAGVDVLSVEPPAANNPLLTAKNCLVTPHIAWAAKEARARLMNLAVENLVAFVNGNPQNVVNP
jgi:lactate dehydrogenase-like 2-hydroxyacid dehydrogenase